MTELELRRAVQEALAEHARFNTCTSACRLTDDDVVFFHRLKNSIDRVATGIGMVIILGIVSAFGFVIKLGVDSWRGGQP